MRAFPEFTEATMSARLVAVRNPVSGSAVSEGALRNALRAAEQTDASIECTTINDPGIGISGLAVAGGADVVLACGGDGTVRACVEGTRGSATTLAVLPAGTGNLLAANLGLPRKPVDAVRLVGAGGRRRIDVGTVNGECFAVMAGTGFDAVMIDGASAKAKKRLGSLAYVIAALRHLRDGLVPSSVEIDGEPFFRGRTTMVLVGNFGEITGGLAVFPQAEADDGRLDVAVMRIESIRDWIRVALAVLRRSPQPADLVDRTTATSVTVVSGRPRLYELDGEVRPPTTELNFGIEPSALRVCVPPMASDVQ